MLLLLLLRGRGRRRRLASAGSAHSVNVLVHFLRRVVLDDDVHVGDVPPPGADVRAQKHALLCLGELEECVRSLRLLELSEDVETRNV